MLLQIIILQVVALILAVFLVFAYDHIFVAKTPFISLEKSTINEIIKGLKLKPNEKFYELGCGDGRVLIIANQIQPKASFVGIEKALFPYILAKIKTHSIQNIQIKLGDIQKLDFTDAKVVFVYLMPNLIEAIKPALMQVIKNGGRVVAVEFGLDSIKPTKTYTLTNQSRHASKWYLYS